MNGEELIINNEEYKCFAFDVGAGLASGKSEKLIVKSENVGACIARPQEDKNNANVVGAAWHAAQGSHTIRPLQINKQSAITLIALIITIIIMLILAGITLNLTLGEHGIFKTATNAKEEYKKAEIKEEIELAILDIEHEEIASGNEITLEKIKEKLPSKLNNITADLENNKITGTYKGYEYEIDNKFNVTIEKNNGTNIDEEETKGTLTISKDLQLWLDKTGEKITLQDILEDETVGEVKGLIPILTAENVTRSEENGIVKYEDVEGGIVSTNSEYGTVFPAYYAFNGVNDPVNSYAASKTGEAENYWLEYEFNQNVKAIYAKVNISSSTYTDGERTYKVQASNDGVNWDDLTTEIYRKGNLSTFPKDILKLNTNKLYKKYRILVTSIGNSTGLATLHSGVLTFQLYGTKTNDNSITKEQIEKKLISSSNINIELSNAVSMNSLMDRLMPKKETEQLILTNENIRNAVLGSTVALSKTTRLNPVVTEENITKITDKKYQDNLGNIMYSDDDVSISDIAESCTWKAFDGKYIEGSWGDSLWTVAANSHLLIYEFTQPVLAYKFKYQISAAQSASYYLKFSIQGSNDGKTWVDLSQDHEMSAYRAITTFEEAPIYNSDTIQKYKMFRVYLKEKGNNTMVTGEFEIYGIK